ncbi:MAG: hypothetical protein LIO40_01105 [Ruminococcus sp.]|nr:hypothetical protein [Ruminococcus sp.]
MKKVQRKFRKINLRRVSVAVMGLAAATITLCMVFTRRESLTDAAAK